MVLEYLLIKLVFGKEICDGNSKIEHNEIMVCFNPRIIKAYSEEVEMEEGCLSYPKLFGKNKKM